MTYKISKPEIQIRWSKDTPFITEDELTTIFKDNAKNQKVDISDETIKNSINQYLSDGLIEKSTEAEANKVSKHLKEEESKE